MPADRPTKAVTKAIRSSTTSKPALTVVGSSSTKVDSAVTRPWRGGLVASWASNW
jgi:hypothetical protein